MASEFQSNFPAGTYTMVQNVQPRHLTFPGYFTMTFEPPSITLEPGIDWDDAAKAFWNAMARVAGQPPPFAEVSSSADHNFVST